MSAGQGVDFFFVFAAGVLDVYLDVQTVEGVADVFELFAGPPKGRPVRLTPFGG